MLTLVEKIDELVWGKTLYDKGLPGRWLTMTMRYVIAVLRDVVSGQLTMRAMSLVYTTLLSIVPLIAFSFSVLKGFGIDKKLEELLYGALVPLGDKGVEITNTIMRLVNNVNGGVLGGISLIFFIYTAISMVQKIEESFNYVWHVSKSRSFARRFSEYSVVLLIGPVIMVVALGLIASIRSNSLVQIVLSDEAVRPLLVVTGKLVPYLLVTGVFTFLYKYMPNTQVRFLPALIGGIGGGFLWASMGAIVASFVVNSARTQAIYASFAIVIITLTWLYLNWLVLLIGAQLAYYVQNPEFLRIGRREPRLSNSMRERLAIDIMLRVGQAFRAPDKSISMQQLSSALKVPSLTLGPAFSALECAGLLVTTESESLLPGRDLARIQLAHILAAVRAHGETGSYREPSFLPTAVSIGKEIDDAVGATVANRTLADLLDKD